MAGRPTSSHRPRPTIFPMPLPAIRAVSSAGRADAAISRPAVTSNLWSPPSFIARQNPLSATTGTDTDMPAGVMTSMHFTASFKESTAPLQAAAAVVPVVRPRRQSRPLERMVHLPLFIFSLTSGSGDRRSQEAGMQNPVTGSFSELSAGSESMTGCGCTTGSLAVSLAESTIRSDLGSGIGVYDLIYGRNGYRRPAASSFCGNGWHL